MKTNETQGFIKSLQAQVEIMMVDFDNKKDEVSRLDKLVAAAEKQGITDTEAFNILLAKRNQARDEIAALMPEFGELSYIKKRLNRAQAQLALRAKNERKEAQKSVV